MLAAIVAICPEFQAEWKADNPYIVGDKFSVHTVYMSFLPYLAAAGCSGKQLRKIAALVDHAVRAGGDSENAVATCFLEHVHQVGLTSALKPLLGSETKAGLV